jgi:hypothetical protein
MPGHRMDTVLARGIQRTSSSPRVTGSPRLTACSVRIARAIRPRVIMAKVINVDEDGMITGVESSPQGFLFEFREAKVHDLASLACAIALAARDPYSIVVRGKPKRAIGRRAMYDDPDAGPANLAVTPRRWVAFDWDNIPVPHNPDSIKYDQAEFANWARPPALFNPGLGVELALRRLPPAFRGVSCVWQITGSAGLKEGFRLRTWHWLSRALPGAQLKCWLNPAIERGLVDPSTLVEVQPHYIGCTIRGGPDPCPQRFGLLERVGDTVPVPEIESIRIRQERRTRERRRTFHAEQTVTVDSITSGDNEAARRIEQCVTAVHRARSGSRHPTFKSELARARALCHRHGIAWQPVLARLRSAYEATLTDAEVKQREKGSINGLPEWIERRAS